MIPSVGMLYFDGKMTLPVIIFIYMVLNYVLSVTGSNPIEYSFPSFEEISRGNFSFVEKANLNLGAMQVTPDTSDTRDEFTIANKYGRVLLKQPFKLWKKTGSNPDTIVMASFNSTFVINIARKNGSGGEGIAFVMAKDNDSAPENSYGQWLGLVNSTTNGNVSNKMVAVEFDTKRNGDYDPDDNHVGINVNTINSNYTASLNPYKIYLNSSSDVVASVQYNGQTGFMKLYVSNNSVSATSNPIISVAINLSLYLENEIYVGFSASTGQDTELNCIRSWNFTMENLGTDIPSSNSVNIAAIVVGLIIGVIAVFVMIVTVVVWRKRHRNIRKYDIGVLLTDSAGGPQKFKLKDLKKATNNFHPTNLLGQGGFGSVYRGNLPGDKSPIAVKRMSEDTNQGEQEFIAEVMIISKLRHRNLVRLLGWCHENGELLLVYDYMPNGSLEKLIFLKDTNGPVLNWEKRYKILCGVALALRYLHDECEQQIIHRDLKASNVMLDSDYNAMLGDFGLARLIEHNKTSYTTTAIAGTPGYIAPECFHTGRATTESDVYGFGAVALEVACGRKPMTETDKYIVDWVWRLFGEGRLLEAADRRLDGDFDEDEMECLLLLGLACSHPNPQERPAIRQVLQILTKDASPPVVPRFKPAFVWPAPPSSLTEILSTSTSDFTSMYFDSGSSESRLLK
eukprot:Gb_41459 [translate_table: standard]